MSPRSYDNSLRKEMEADTVRRIIDATVALHAEKGASATTHADIAGAAGVSVATVYKHFPSREALLPHCTGMVMRQIPQIDAREILAARSRKEQISRLVHALHGRYRYAHPWMRWTARDAPLLPTLAQIVEDGRQRTEKLLRDILDGIAGAPVGDEHFALAMVVLDYPAWQRLSKMLNDPERVSCTAEQALHLLMSKLPPQKGSNHGKHAARDDDGG